ncbi:hypothetical protein [Kribbella sp. NPDC051770]|uniref:hypothetical protein n=1 Tax=Kribbella sp. NPDC051770 TaxID=3155413 RepID=UPI00343B3637
MTEGTGAHAQRSQTCGATAEMNTPGVSAHDQHICRRPADHGPDHRCSVCPHQWTAR